jgi:hypothetical protein
MSDSFIPPGHDVNEVILKNKRGELVSIKLSPQEAFADYIRSRADDMTSPEIEAAEEAFYFGLIHAATVVETCIRVIPSPDDKRIIDRFLELVIELAKEHAANPNQED